MNTVGKSALADPRNTVGNNNLRKIAIDKRVFAYAFKSVRQSNRLYVAPILETEKRRDICRGRIRNRWGRLSSRFDP